jgi:putative chitinase
MHQYPHRMLEHEPAALVLYDGCIEGWFTGVGLPEFFNDSREDPYEARTVVNGHDKADLIEGYYWQFKKALE